MKYLSSFVLLGTALASLGASACTDSSSVGTNGHKDGGADGSAAGASSGGASSSGGAKSTGGGSSTGGGGAAAAGGASSSGGAKSTGGGSSTGTDGGTPDGGVATDPCTGTDPTEPNETRDKTTPYTLGSTVLGCVADSDDHDFYEFTVPADIAGGYVQISLTNVGDGYIQTHVYSATDNGEIHNTYAASKGQSINTFLGVAKGQKYRVDVTNFSAFSSAYAYTLKATYTSLADTFEANDTRDAAKAITKATPIEAFIAAGYTTADAPTNAAYDDWYSVVLTAGTVTAKIENVATDVYGDLELFDSTGTSVIEDEGGTQGASVTVTHAVTAGTYYVRVGAFSVTPDASGDTAAVTDHFTRKYKLTVSQ